MHRIRIAQPFVTGTCEIGTMYSCVRRIKTSGWPWTFPAPSTFLRRPLSPARPLIPTQNLNDAPRTTRSAPVTRGGSHLCVVAALQRLGAVRGYVGGFWDGRGGRTQ